MAYMSLKNQKRILLMLIVCCTVIVVLFGRLVYIQVIKYDHYSQMAYEQQTKERTVEAKRGTIYDTTGTKILAQSISVNLITVVPKSIDKDKKEQIADKLSEILEIDRDGVLAKLSKNSASEIIATKIDDEKANKILEYINEEELTGIRVDEDTQRVYPYTTLLSHVLGFVGTDNQGLAGIEAYYDDELSGIPGKIVGSTDGKGRETPFTNEQYISSTNGKDLVLTVDATIQSIVEKYLSKAVIENVAQYATATVLNPNTGEVLAMATYPTFDSNDPFTINDETIKASWDTLSSKEKSEALENMWRNKCISDTAEPGSTFKIITATAALEENVVQLDTPGEFSCAGIMKVGTWNIKCWRYPNSHGSESLREGIMNSCNPVFMQLSQRLGIEKYCEYLDAFNLYGKTGIDLPGEATGIMHDRKSMAVIDLATTSFGQTIQISTIQTAVNYSAVANGGYLIKPYIVKEIKSNTENYDKKVESQILKQVMSKETADSLLSALESTATDGTAKTGSVNGYRIAGKTATGENGRGSNLKYLAGYAAIAPVSSPQVVVVVNVFDAKGPSGHGGGAVAGPVVSSILDETLRYLDIPTDYTSEDNDIVEKVVPDLTGMSFAEAKTTITSSGFKFATDVNLNDTDIIKGQIPKSGASLMEGSSIRLYASDDAKQTVSVPDVRNMTSTAAIKALHSAELNVRIVGSGTVLTQDTSAGNVVEKGSIITIHCGDTTDLP